MHIHEASAQQVTHPILIIAAVAVVLFCSVGTAAILGWLPSSSGSGYEPVPALQRPVASAPAPQEPVQLALATQATQPAPAAPPAAQPPVPAQQWAQAPQADEPSAPRPAPSAPPAHHCSNCGVITAIHEVQTRGQGSGLGAAGGAVLGGLLGNQVGSGHGRQLATVAGAIGGAVAGNQIEGNMKSSHSYNVVVRMDDGRTRTVHLKSAQNWRAGDPVRIVNGTLRAAR